VEVTRDLKPEIEFPIATGAVLIVDTAPKLEAEGLRAPVKGLRFTPGLDDRLVDGLLGVIFVIIAPPTKPGVF
jgi:hypothetical protein